MKTEIVMTSEGMDALARGEQPPIVLLEFQILPTNDGRIGILMTEEGWKEFLATMAIGDADARHGIVSHIGHRFGWSTKDDE